MQKTATSGESVSLADVWAEIYSLLLLNNGLHSFDRRSNSKWRLSNLGKHPRHRDLAINNGGRRRISRNDPGVGIITSILTMKDSAFTQPPPMLTHIERVLRVKQDVLPASAPRTPHIHKRDCQFHMSRSLLLLRVHQPLRIPRKSSSQHCRLENPDTVY